MRHAHDQHRDPLVLDPRHHAVITDAPAPVSGMLADQRAADRSRIVERGDAFFERLDDPRRDLPVELRNAFAAPPKNTFLLGFRLLHPCR